MGLKLQDISMLDKFEFEDVLLKQPNEKRDSRVILTRMTLIIIKRNGGFF